jgi:DNA-directed RNA polymerase subunit RPC12/RpoP
MPVTDNLIHFKCSQCKQELEAPEFMQGKTILCHHCQSSVNVETTEHQPESSKEDEPIQFRLKKETKDCPYCGEEILEVAKKCKHCGEFLESNIVNSYQAGYSNTPIENTPKSKLDNHKKTGLWAWILLYIIIAIFSASIIFSLTYAILSETHYYSSPVEKKLLSKVKELEKVPSEGNLEAFRLALENADVDESIKASGNHVISCAEDVIHLIGVSVDNSGDMGFGGAFAVGGMIGLAKQDLYEAIDEFKDFLK